MLPCISVSTICFRLVFVLFPVMLFHCAQKINPFLEKKYEIAVLIMNIDYVESYRIFQELLKHYTLTPNIKNHISKQIKELERRRVTQIQYDPCPPQKLQGKIIEGQPLSRRDVSCLAVNKKKYLSFPQPGYLQIMDRQGTPIPSPTLSLMFLQDTHFFRYVKNMAKEFPKKKGSITILSSQPYGATPNHGSKPASVGAAITKRCIKATIVTETQVPVAGLIVETMPSTEPTVTNQQGFFQICNFRRYQAGKVWKAPISPGVYTLLVSRRTPTKRCSVSLVRFWFQGRTVYFPPLVLSDSACIPTGIFFHKGDFPIPIQR